MKLLGFANASQEENRDSDLFLLKASTRGPYIIHLLPARGDPGRYSGSP